MSDTPRPDVTWRDMSTAPRDGSKVLVGTHRNLVEIAWWDADAYAKHPQPFWKTSGPWGVRQNREHPPLAWMPLPHPPTKSPGSLEFHRTPSASTA